MYCYKIASYGLEDLGLQVKISCILKLIRNPVLAPSVNK